MKYGFSVALFAFIFLYTGCSIPFIGTSSKAPVIESFKRTTVDKIIISDMDIFDRPYTLLGDVNVRIEQRLPFGEESIKERATKALQEKASTMDADAVIFVRYEILGKTWTRWSGMDVKGSAIKFSYY